MTRHIMRLIGKNLDLESVEAKSIEGISEQVLVLEQVMRNVPSLDRLRPSGSWPVCNCENAMNKMSL